MQKGRNEMKHITGILALALAALTLVACANTPAPVVTDENTTAATTIDVPSTTEVPATTDTPETTAAPVTTAAPATTEAPATTVVPVTTAAPSTTAAPVTTKAPETTAAPATTTAPVTTSTGKHNLPISFSLPEFYEDKRTTGMEEPFYWIDETHIGVRGFDEVVLPVSGQYLTVRDLINDTTSNRNYVLTEKPDVNRRPAPFPFSDCEPGVPSSCSTLRFSENCILRVYHIQGPPTRFIIDLISNETVSLFSERSLLPYYMHESFVPIYKSDDEKTVIYLQYRFASTTSISIKKATLDDDLRYIIKLDELNYFRSSRDSGVCFNGAYGFVFFRVNSYTDENGETTNFYTFLATKDYGDTWVILDPKIDGLPELTLTREQGDDGNTRVTLTREQ